MQESTICGWASSRSLPLIWSPLIKVSLSCQDTPCLSRYPFPAKEPPSCIFVRPPFLHNLAKATAIPSAHAACVVATIAFKVGRKHDGKRATASKTHLQPVLASLLNRPMDCMYHSHEVATTPCYKHRTSMALGSGRASLNNSGSTWEDSQQSCAFMKPSSPS